MKGGNSSKDDQILEKNKVGYQSYFVTVKSMLSSWLVAKQAKA